MRRAPFFLLLLVVPSLFAIEIFPPAPDSQTDVRVKFAQSRQCAAIGHASLSGSTITLTTTPMPHVSCFESSTPQPVLAELGVLRAGVYEIRTEDNEHATLIVRDADSGIFVSPVGISTASRRTVQVYSTTLFAAPALSVAFDGIAATIESRGADSVLVTPPPHGPGTVDVTVTNSDGAFTSVAAFTYFDPTAPIDPQIFEPVLFPVAYDGPGIFGSQWRTENEIATTDTIVRFREVQQVSACNGACGALRWSALLSRQSSSGVLLWVVRRRVPPASAIEDDFRVSSRIIELSHPDEVNTTVPVARERDFRRRFVIDRVPVRADARATLRLYAPVDARRSAVVVVNEGGDELRQPVALTPVNGVAYAIMDLPPASLRTPLAMVTVFSDDRIWGLITVTENATQRVTAFSPQ